MIKNKFKQTEIGKIPVDWDILTLEEATEKIIDYRGKTPKKTKYGIPLITAKIVKNGQILEPEEFISEDDYDEWMRRGRPQQGDVIITTEAPMGEVAQLDNRKVALAQRLITLRGRTEIFDNNFMRFVLQSPILQNELIKRESGTTVTGIKQSELRKVLLPVPSYTEQKAIAKILSDLDDKIEVLQKQNKTLEEIGRTIFHHWFVDFEFPDENGKPYKFSGGKMIKSELGEIPKGWEVETVGDIVVVKGGTTPNTKVKEYWDAGVVNWCTPKDLSNLNSPILLDTERKITEKGLANISSGLLPKGILLLSSRAPIGYLAISEIPVAINQGFIAILCDGKVSNYYMLNWINFNLEVIKNRAGGSIFQEINKTNFRSIMILVPTQDILKIYNMVLNKTYKKIVLNEKLSTNLSQIRNNLLPKLMSGQIRVK